MCPALAPPPVCLVLRPSEDVDDACIVAALFKNQQVEPQGQKEFLWKVDNKYYTACVKVQLVSKEEASKALEADVDAWPAWLRPCQALAAYLAKEADQRVVADLLAVLRKLTAATESDCTLLVAERGFKSEADAERVADGCLEDGKSLVALEPHSHSGPTLIGVELIDFTEDDDEEDGENSDDDGQAEGIFARGSRDRPAEALQSVMWAGMQRKACTRPQPEGPTEEPQASVGPRPPPQSAAPDLPPGELEEELLHDLRRVRESIAGEGDSEVRRRRAEEVTMRLVAMLGLDDDEDPNADSADGDDHHHSS